MGLLIQQAVLEEQIVNILIEDGLITAIDKTIVAPDNFTVINAEHKIAVPGLVNGHSHAAMTLMRGYGDDMPLTEWLKQRIWPAEAKLTEEDVYVGTKLACLEMIRSGTLTFCDMYWHFHGMARAVEEMGLNAVVGAVIIDVAGEKQAQACKDNVENLLTSISQYSKRVTLALTPHAIYTVSPSTLEWTAMFSRKHNLPVHIHLSETEQEVTNCLERYNVRPAMHLDNLGMLTDRTILAHGVFLDNDELDLIEKRGCTLITNPVSNMKLAVGGVFPYREVSKRSIPLAIGTDGAASNNSLDLFQDTKFFSLLQKHHTKDPTILPAKEAWKIATGGCAPILGHVSKIAVGARADFILLNPDGIEMSPQHCLHSNLVYAATNSIVDTVIVNGQLLMQGRKIKNETAIRQAAVAVAHRICK